MIRIGDRYMITADDHCFVVNDILKRGQNTKDPGSEYLRPFAYHATLTGSLEAVAKRLQREIVADQTEMPLGEAIRRMRDIEAKIGRMIERRAGGM
jgi:hypothetical protein